MKFLIAGLGGVGGYFGGLLAKHYEHSDAIDVCFYARSENLKAISTNGLLVKKGEEHFTAKPAMVSNNAVDFGKVDILIIATKSYDLHSILNELEICVGENTIIIPLLNGVDHHQYIQTKFPNNTVLNACVYIVSRLTKPGLVENIGNIESLYFGIDKAGDSSFQYIEKIFTDAGIDAHYSDSISSIIWEKYIFLSPIASITSCYNKSIGEILEDELLSEKLFQLNKEVYQLAQAKNITLPQDILEKTKAKYHKLPYDTTSSMHADFKNKKPFTEVQSLTQYVIAESKKYGLDTPTYDLIPIPIAIGIDT